MSPHVAGRGHVYWLGAGLHAESEQLVAGGEPGAEEGSASRALGRHPLHLHTPPPHRPRIPPSEDDLSTEEGQWKCNLRAVSAYFSVQLLFLTSF